MTMAGYRPDLQTNEEEHTAIAGFRPPCVSVVSEETTDCSEVYDTFHSCGNQKSLHWSPNGLSKDIDDHRKLFYQSGIKFMDDLMDTRKIFTENNNCRLWFFQKNDSRWWTAGPHNEETIKKYKEAIFATAEYIAENSKVDVSTYLEMGTNSWIIFSKWRNLSSSMSDLDLQAATGTMHHYVLDNGSPTEFKNMWAEEDLLREVQREWSFWYKLHPVPNLTENREVDVMEWCKAVEWWRRWVRRLKPATVEYLNRQFWPPEAVSKIEPAKFSPCHLPCNNKSLQEDESPLVSSREPRAAGAQGQACQQGLFNHKV